MDLTAEIVLRGYMMGLFPMSESVMDKDVQFVCPEDRAIIPIENIHIPKSLKKTLKKNPYEVTFNTDFPLVIDECAAIGLDRTDTWINEKILNVYLELHELGFAHSVEVWEVKNEFEKTIVGGLYGVAMGGAFFGESMFSRRTNASKIALVYLAARLRRLGYKLLDAQFENEHLRQFGLYTIKHNKFMAILEDVLKIDCRFDTSPSEPNESLKFFLS